ncbi:hypothetical protein HG1285_02338 [Hydrogenivirga sp. 128-5-R1-1]|nr:hypothetical protein HG1285_02338 [Hydrogenivirga sp. 128-5-R1-1]
MDKIDFNTFALVLGGTALLITLVLILISKAFQGHEKLS